ncbi:AtpZ/AtpI family protein [Roseomonas sp. F4]
MAEDDGFEQRLRQARARQGMDPKPRLNGPLSGSSANVGFRAGVEVVSALVVGVALGWYLDRWLGTWPWLFLLFFVFGSVAGVMNVYRLFAPGRGAGKQD